MKKTFRELSDWVFEITETSANVYEIKGKSRTGLTTSAQGSETEFDELLDRVKKQAIALNAEARR